MTRILFVDDDPITLKMLCKLAEMEGHDTMTADSGKMALSTATEAAPDLIILDMSMPDMDGISVIREMRARPETAQIPIVILSAGFELDAPEQVTAAGAQGYLSKPINVQELQEVIDKFAA
jgi:two-component system cell cycle response regulator DivK